MWRLSGQSVTASDIGSNGRCESGRGRCVESLERLFTPIVRRRSLHISFCYLSGHPYKIYTGKYLHA